MNARKAIPGILAMLLLVPGALWAQEEGSGGPEHLITVTSVKPLKQRDPETKKEVWVLKVTGKAPKVPAGTEIDMVVKWMAAEELGQFSFVLDASRRFSKEFELDFINGFIDGLYLRAEIKPTKQSREIQDAIAKRTDDFPPERAPWPVNFRGKMFSIGTAEDLEKQKAEIREYFRTTIVKLAEIEAEYSSTTDQVRSKEKFVEGGQLAPALYRKWIDEEVRDPLREIQSDIREKSTSNTAYIPVSRDLRYLKDLASAVAKLSVLDSRALYEEFGLTPDPDDQSPRGLDIGYRRDPTAKRLNTLVQRLCDSQGITLDELSN